MTVMSIDPRSAAEMLAAGAILVDIRAPDEHAREKIVGALSRPLDQLQPIDADAPVIFHCKTGQRTRMNSARLAHASGGLAYLLEGGIDGWRAAGLPVISEGARPSRVPDLMRQVQLVGGLLVLLAALLGFLVSRWFLLLDGAIGLGMIHAGATGSCAMTRLLAPMPWNRVSA